LSSISFDVPVVKRKEVSWTATWFGYVWRRKCLLKHVMEGKAEGRIEVTGTRGRRSKQLLDLKQTTGYWKLKEGAVDDTLWRTHFGICCGLPNGATEWR
jgi:hypothetical protein